MIILTMFCAAVAADGVHTTKNDCIDAENPVLSAVSSDH